MKEGSAWKACYNQLTRQTLSEFYRKDRNANCVISPYSVLTLLAMMVLSSEGSTREEVLQALKMPTSKALIQSVSEFTSILDQTQCLTSANAAAVNAEMESCIHQDFSQQFAQHLSGKLFAAADLPQAINAWVSDRTHGMIPKIVGDSDLLDFALINAVYFDAKWQEPYEEDDLEEGRVFRNSNGTKSEVRMMNSTEDQYIESEDYTGFVRPYQRDFAFVALLPKKKGKRAMQKIVDTVDFSKVYRDRREEKVNAALPEFQNSFRQDLSEFLKTQGIRKAFGTEADFSPITDFPVSISSVLHQAKIEVNPHGTKAAAATVVACAALGLPVFHPEVVLNRPFLYAIVHTQTALPVFVGVVNDLKEGEEPCAKN
jgi:serine protease inhibitor